MLRVFACMLLMMLLGVGIGIGCTAAAVDLVVGVAGPVKSWTSTEVLASPRRLIN